MLAIVILQQKALHSEFSKSPEIWHMVMNIYIFVRKTPNTFPRSSHLEMKGQNRFFFFQADMK